MDIKVLPHHEDAAAAERRAVLLAPVLVPHV